MKPRTCSARPRWRPQPAPRSHRRHAGGAPVKPPQALLLPLDPVRRRRRRGVGEWPTRLFIALLDAATWSVPPTWILAGAIALAFAAAVWICAEGDPWRLFQ